MRGRRGSEGKKLLLELPDDDIDALRERVRHWREAAGHQSLFG